MLKFVELRYEGTKPFHLVGTIPEYFLKSGQRLQHVQDCNKGKTPERDFININRFSIKRDANSPKQQVVMVLKKLAFQKITKG